MNRVVMFSGGAGSRAAAKRVAAEHGIADLTLLFADTLVEHRETYRCLIEGAANIAGVKASEILLKAVECLPDVQPDDAAMSYRKKMLQYIASEAHRQIPILTWIRDGRTPWEVCLDERFVANSRIDPCSKFLKRMLQDRWRDEHCDPAQTVCYVGLDWSEIHRFVGRGKPGLRGRMAELGWRYEAPMCNRPYLTKAQMLDEMRADGIHPSQTYEDGFPHDNCSGGCFKAGHANWRLTLEKRPSVYAYNEQQEQKAIGILGPDATILKDRRGDGKKKPLSLRQFREAIETQARMPLLEEEWGGCGCAIDD